ncbi:VOC family protein [uncultured Roseibium sp.]|uniref:VOC family protein n=1 Tax=uncultured Roseibium sp. TaxID=1936171 RepID=UPI002623E72D|nr:VOC family protein [uncultured Roseibium sp.]
MQIEKLDHVNLRTKQLQTMVVWYESVLGLMSGPRPDFPFAGAWLYAGEQAVVHLVEIEGDHAVGSEKELKLEHFAFTATGLEEFEHRLQQSGEEYRRSGPPGLDLVAFNLWDPDGNHIHVDFVSNG